MYWPQQGQGALVQRGGITVETQLESVDQFCLMRKFRLSKADQSLEVTQLQYTGWPDHGAPGEFDSVVDFFSRYRKVRQQALESGPMGPVVVHCSAGVGRSGTFIGIDMMLDKLASCPDHTAELNLYALVDALRGSRCQMVQSVDQYGFLYKFMDHCIEKGLFGVGIRMRPAFADNAMSSSSSSAGGGSAGDASQNEEIVRLRESLSVVRKSLEDANWQKEVLSKLVERLEDRYISARVEVAKLTQQLQAQRSTS